MISIVPQTPTSDDHVVFEFAGGTFGCSEISQFVEDSHFHYEASNTAGPCLSAPIPFEASWDVGRLMAGDYQATYIDAAFGPETEAFTVLQGQLPFPAPAIPSLGTAGAIVLAIVLAWLAFQFLKQRAA